MNYFCNNVHNCTIILVLITKFLVLITIQYIKFYKQILEIRLASISMRRNTTVLLKMNGNFNNPRTKI